MQVTLLNRTILETEPFSFDLVKKHCRIDNPDDDELAKLYMEASFEYGEHLTRRVWRLSECDLEILNVTNPMINIPISPCIEVISFKGVFSGVEEDIVEEDIVEEDIVEEGIVEEDIVDYEFNRSSFTPQGGRPFANIVLSREAIQKYEKYSLKVKVGFPLDSFPSVFTRWILIKTASNYEQREDLASATRKIAIGLPRSFVDGSLDIWFLPLGLSEVANGFTPRSTTTWV